MSYTAKMQFVPEMTRKEAISKCHGIAYPEVFVQALEALGVIKTKEPEVIKLFEHESVDGGAIKLETWPEGLVLWVNGKIKYKYWEDTDNQK